MGLEIFIVQKILIERAFQHIIFKSNKKVTKPSPHYFEEADKLGFVALTNGNLFFPFCTIVYCYSRTNYCCTYSYP